MSPRWASPGRYVLSVFLRPDFLFYVLFFEFNFDVRLSPCITFVAVAATAVDRLPVPVPSATELAVVSSKAALASAGMDPGLIDATFVGNVIQSRFVTDTKNKK